MLKNVNLNSRVNKSFEKIQDFDLILISVTAIKLQTTFGNKVKT